MNLSRAQIVRALFDDEPPMSISPEWLREWGDLEALQRARMADEARKREIDACARSRSWRRCLRKWSAKHAR